MFGTWNIGSFNWLGPERMVAIELVNYEFDLVGVGIGESLISTMAPPPPPSVIHRSTSSELHHRY
jgi:hypothetical protein